MTPRFSGAADLSRFMEPLNWEMQAAGNAPLSMNGGWMRRPASRGEPRRNKPALSKISARRMLLLEPGGHLENRG
jgi:hypothetical protein